jgi:hypothetical protein
VQTHHQQGALYSCLLKLQLLKLPIKIHRCVVMWLYYWVHVGVCTLHCSEGDWVRECVAGYVTCEPARTRCTVCMWKLSSI